jgi:ADP-heptose:LPS heptosyltransferase
LAGREKVSGFGGGFRPDFRAASMKPKLLAVELWGMGDLALATPFLRAATQAFEVALLARPLALELQPRLWPGVEVISFEFPWTAFRGKYVLTRWPWRRLARLAGELRRRRFDLGISARWDPRDHALLRLSGAGRRAGFPRAGSALLLTERLAPPPVEAHRYENWRALGRHLGMELPSQKEAVAAQPFPPSHPIPPRGGVVIHSGAAQPARVWPLERFGFLARQLRRQGYAVEVVCDAGQREWWTGQGEKARTPGTIGELLAILDRAGLFVGNDSGPGHLAGILGIPTFTLFGDQFSSRFVPLGPQAEWMEGSDCVYKPCYDACRFARPECLWGIGEDAAWLKLKNFAARHLNAAAPSQ